ncbi:MAG: ABC transporter substrate-binding protein [Christensenellales bacterium]|jgi:peptide/nickel transport system substrate-binding protein
MITIKKLTLLTLLSALVCALILPAAGEGVDLTNADITIGYAAASGAKLNPFLCAERDMLSINALVYEPLFELDAQMRPRAVLADNWTQDDKTWQIEIRPGILFHNGIELSAQDVADSYSLYKQAGEKNPYHARLSLVTSIEATGAYTLAVTGRYPGMITLYALTFPVVQRGTATTTLPMGTGPYWYIHYQEDVGARLEANPFWWKQQPEIESIAFRHFYLVSEQLSALQAGEIELFQTRSSAAALTKKLSYATSLDYTTSAYEMLVPNLSGAMADVRLRKAILYAIDYNTLIANVYLDMAQQCEVPVPPGSWLYESKSAVYHYSPERALQYLYDAGWADQTGNNLLSKVEGDMLQYISFEIITYDDAASNVRGNAAAQIAENLRTVGIDATVVKLTKSEVSKRLRNGDYDLALVAANLSEIPNLVPLLSEDGALNFSNTASDETNQLLAATVSAADEPALKAAYSAIQLHIVDELPVMGLCFRTGMLLATRPLAGLTGVREYDAYNGMEFLSK